MIILFIKNAKCFNGIDLERPTLVKNCACTVDDYECDVKFKRSENACVPIEERLFNIPAEQCHHFYTISSGYRKVSGNTCEGGMSYQDVHMPCPKVYKTLGYTGLIVFMLICFYVYFAWNREKKDY